MWVFEEVYKANLGPILRYALRHTGRRDWAEDVTSETFLELYRRKETVQAEQLPAWLYTVARNRAIDYWRRRSREEELDFSTVPETRFSAESFSFEELLAEKSLKPSHRVCLILRFVHGMSREEIAHELGWKESRVKGHLQYALRLLRNCMEATGHAQRAKTQSQ
jgi:RNA polymerase sigma-70 factor, ECF subfamily